MDLKIELFETVPCLLCLSSQEPANSLCSELEPKVVSVLCRHFWFTTEDIQQKYVCSACWAQVDEFNTFYELVERIHHAEEQNQHDGSKLEPLPTEDSCAYAESPETDEIHESLPDDSDSETVLIETSEELNLEEVSGESVVFTIERNTKESPQQSDEIETEPNFDNVIEFEHHEESEDATQNGPEVAESYKCDQCDRVYPKRHLLNRHRKQHVAENGLQFACSECGNEYLSETRLQQHKKRVHGPGFMCDACPKWYKTGEALRRHQKDSHNPYETERVECHICKRWLKNKGSLRKHLNRHKTSGMQNVCEICGKVAPTHTALKSHKLFVHKMQKSYQCNVCYKAFKRAFTLEEHMTIHTGSTLYKCPHCPKTFNSSANLHGHKKKAHPKEWERSRIEYEKRFVGDSIYEEEIIVV